MKIKFAGLLRSWFHYFEDKQATPAPERPAASAPVAAETAVARPSASMKAPLSSTQPIPIPPSSTSANPNEIQLPLQPILAALAMELRAKIMSINTTGMMIALPVDKVLTQLATGSVKISFGELRQLAPGVFANSGGEHDAKSVVLPLSQILAQINPSLLARRSAQKKVAVTDEVSSPFNTHGEGLKISSAPLKAPVPPPQLPRMAPIIEEAPAPSLPARPVPAFASHNGAPKPSAHDRQVTPQNENGARNGVNGSHKLASFDTSFADSINGAPQISIEPPVLAPLNSLAESWPESLRLEIVQLDLGNAQIALPANLVEPALKRGRVIFSWRDLRSWIKPASPGVSVHDSLELELPLKVLAPLFFSRHKNGAGRKKISVAEEIPNLFFGFPQPASEPDLPRPSAAGVPPPDTNFFIRGNQPQTSDSEFKRKGGTDFLSRGATPAEVVARAMELSGVAGAVIALPDGLKVASLIPADLNGDTLAAFLPQIFARVSQCSRELRMGDVNNLSFTVGNVPWKIFRVNAVYFAAFGRANESLPTTQLAALATELDRKKQ